VCPVSRRAVRVGLLATIRAGKQHVVTASKCFIYCLSSYLITLRNCAVITRRDFLWLHGDRRGGFLVGQLLMQFNATVMNYYFTAAVMSLNGFWEALAVRGVRAWTCFCPRVSDRVLQARMGLHGAKRVHRRRPVSAQLQERKQTHKKAKSFAGRNLGGQSPSIIIL